MYTAGEDLNDIAEAALAYKGRENVFARRWGLFAQFAARVSGPSHPPRCLGSQRSGHARSIGRRVSLFNDEKV